MPTTSTGSPARRRAKAGTTASSFRASMTSGTSKRRPAKCGRSRICAIGLNLRVVGEPEHGPDIDVGSVLDLDTARLRGLDHRAFHALGRERLFGDFCDAVSAGR